MAACPDGRHDFADDKKVLGERFLDFGLWSLSIIVALFYEISETELKTGDLTWLN